MQLNLTSEVVKHSIGDLRESERAKYTAEYFERHYWREDLPGMVGNHGLCYDDPSHERRFSYLYELLVREYPITRLLDVGCGPGYLVEAALTNDIEAFGLDFSAAACASFNDRTHGKLRDHFCLTPMANIPFGDREFDLCLCLDVLEHVIIFDVYDSVRELCRVAADHVICSINLDNPYAFHPTILSRESWIAIFENFGSVVYNRDRTDRLNSKVRIEYPEYDFFVFERS